MKDEIQITDDQIRTMDDFLQKDTWDHIYENILTKEQRKEMKKNKGFRKTVAFQMEDVFKRVAATFGLAGFED